MKKKRLTPRPSKAEHRGRRNEKAFATQAIMEALSRMHTGGSLLSITDALIAHQIFVDEALVKTILLQQRAQGFVSTVDHHVCDCCKRPTSWFRITEEGREKLHEDRFLPAENIVDIDEPGLTA